jgi:hypothetical protein
MAEWAVGNARSDESRLSLVIASYLARVADEAARDIRLAAAPEAPETCAAVYVAQYRRHFGRRQSSVCLHLSLDLPRRKGDTSAGVRMPHFTPQSRRKRGEETPLACQWCAPLPSGSS